jgi:hypothetical protein
MGQIVQATKDVLDSTPQIVQAKSHLATIEAARDLTAAIKDQMAFMAQHPEPGAAGYTQTENLKVLTASLQTLLERMAAPTGPVQRSG